MQGNSVVRKFQWVLIWAKVVYGYTADITELNRDLFRDVKKSN
jgi:hypothetical protein